MLILIEVVCPQFSSLYLSKLPISFPKFLLNPFRNRLRHFAQLPFLVFSRNRTFPHNSDAKSVFKVGLRDFLVARLVPLDFSLPIISVSFWQAEKLAVFVSVPEAAVYENYGFVVRKKNVRRSEKPSVVLAEPKSGTEKRASQNCFGLCVLAVDFRHVLASLFRRQSIHFFFSLF